MALVMYQHNVMPLYNHDIMYRSICHAALLRTILSIKLCEYTGCSCSNVNVKSAAEVLYNLDPDGCTDRQRILVDPEIPNVMRHCLCIFRTATDEEETARSDNCVKREWLGLRLNSWRRRIIIGPFVEKKSEIFTRHRPTSIMNSVRCDFLGWIIDVFDWFCWWIDDRRCFFEIG